MMRERAMGLQQPVARSETAPQKAKGRLITGPVAAAVSRRFVDTRFGVITSN